MLGWFDPKATSRMDIIMGLMLNEDNSVFDVIHDDGGDSAQVSQIFKVDAPAINTKWSS